ncbi:MAG: hypothetical protein LBM70_01135 [Victivallales bacterium]|nr:hypothetical protein [Victivallales bacterium]
MFRVVLAKFPTDPVSHANLGETLIKMQWYEAGIRELQTARILDPNQPNIDFSLSRAYKELGDHAAAERYFQLGSERLAQQQHRMQANESAAAKTITSSSTESGEAKHEQN